MQDDAVFGADAPRVAAVREGLAGVGRLGVAYSGGVDSATLLALAVRALGVGRVVAILGVSPSLAASERASAHDVAASRERDVRLRRACRAAALTSRLAAARRSPGRNWGQT